jgi:hypothetical protein
MTRACIHLEMYKHLVSDGICQETIDTIFDLIGQEVLKTSTAKISTIVLAVNKEFLDGYLIHSGLGPKEMLWGKALEDVWDKFEILSWPNVQNMNIHCLKAVTREESLIVS